MKKLLLICGPTATGKTELGVHLAKKFNGEIVSADSRQVYIGMDIGTGKDLPVNSKIKMKNEKLQIKVKNQQIFKPYRFRETPIWMLDVVRPNQEFSVADYVNLAERAIANIRERKKLPIVVGGTGFYIKALVDEVETLGIPPDWGLRRRLERQSANELWEMLCRIDPLKAASMNISDRKNPRRLIRAIEVALKNKNEKIKYKNDTEKLKIEESDILFIGLTAPYKILYERIDRRVDKQVKMGAEEEIRKLLTQGYTWDLLAMSAMGYDVWRPYFENEIPRPDVIKKWKFAEHAYARRQITWFKKDKRIKWFDIVKPGWENEVEQTVGRWYNLNR